MGRWLCRPLRIGYNRCTGVFRPPILQKWVIEMTDIHEPGQTSQHQFNGISETERLELLVKQLQTECESLRQALARSEMERNLYLKAVYAHERERALLEFPDVDFDELKKASAGPVELLE
jgi:hypothetical protein